MTWAFTLIGIVPTLFFTTLLQADPSEWSKLKSQGNWERLIDDLSKVPAEKRDPQWTRFANEAGVEYLHGLRKESTRDALRKSALTLQKLPILTTNRSFLERRNEMVAAFLYSCVQSPKDDLDCLGEVISFIPPETNNFAFIKLLAAIVSQSLGKDKSIVVFSCFEFENNPTLCDDPDFRSSIQLGKAARDKRVKGALDKLSNGPCKSQIGSAVRQ